MPEVAALGIYDVRLRHEGNLSASFPEQPLPLEGRPLLIIIIACPPTAGGVEFNDPVAAHCPNSLLRGGYPLPSKRMSRAS
jgi:hypothetical protein